jgi:tyrosine-protein kinase Etk/Wzc
VASQDLSVEALRSFRTSLKFAMLEAKNNIITITGIAPGVGKSFISANFAYLLAQAGYSVLLIDGDLRRGHLRNYFKPSATLGLAEYVVGNCALNDILIKNKDPNLKLDFIATGNYPPNPSELFMSHQFKEFLADISTRYNFVIVDTAPILAVTDAAIIAQYAGANFLIVGAGMHDPEEVSAALSRFSANGVAINGAVFNFKQIRKSGFYHYGYQYHYKYGYYSAQRDSQ